MPSQIGEHWNAKIKKKVRKSIFFGKGGLRIEN